LGQFSVLHTFGSDTNSMGDPLDGAGPTGLVQGTNGNFYGTTQFGGANDDLIGLYGGYYLGNPGSGDGTVFCMSPAGDNTFTNLLSFDRMFLDGYTPFGQLIPGTDGTFYGVASGGGVNKAGALFALKANNTASNIFWLANTTGDYGRFFDQFPFYTDSGAGMPLPLSLGLDGNYYGTTTDGGAYGFGTVYVLRKTTPPVSFVTTPGSTYYSGGQLHLTVSGLIGQGTLVIEASTNLVQWSQIFSTPPTTGAVQFADPNSGNYHSRYYRAVITNP
jgi:hypothetical protein